ncbi:unnamed protein product [Camellia sinensis]
MGKGGKGRKSDNKYPKKRATVYHHAPSADDVDDEIDTFHKQRDIVPLDINDNSGESDEDDEHPVFDFKDANDDDEDEYENIDDDTGLVAKIVRQQKYFRAKDGGVEDEMLDDAEDEEEKRSTWGRRKNIYHDGDNVDYELQSSDELLAEEEAEVLRLQKEKVKSLSMEDFGVEDVSQDESDGGPTLEEILVKGKVPSKALADKEARDDPGAAYEEVKKDLNALSKEEQMDVVYRILKEICAGMKKKPMNTCSSYVLLLRVCEKMLSLNHIDRIPLGWSVIVAEMVKDIRARACLLRRVKNSSHNWHVCLDWGLPSSLLHSAPELVGLLSELSDALDELENKVNPLLSKVKKGGNSMKGGMHYMEVKQLLLLAYCQAITFYLLLKSEGNPVRDHPVIARLVEIKTLLDKASLLGLRNSLVDHSLMIITATGVKQLDENLPSELEDVLSKKQQTEKVGKLLGEDVALASDSFINAHTVSVGKHEATVVLREAAQVVKVDSSKVDESKGRKRKHLSMEMLKVRAALEEKLRQKGIFGSIASKRDKVQKRRLVNGQLETLDDFDDDTTALEGGTPGMSKGQATSLRSSKLSQLVTPRVNKPKVVSGDDDLPQRDDIGERRRKLELRVLAGAGIKSGDDVDDGPGNLESDGDTDMEEEEDEEEGGESESDDEFYKQVKQQRDAKLAAKAGMYGRTSAVPSMPEVTLVDGKRQITYQMEKNRGLTRARKKLIKNPRKKYKLKHQKAVVRRKGQVRDIKKPMGSYGGEASGINAGISRSIRFKN